MLRYLVRLEVVRRRSALRVLWPRLHRRNGRGTPSQSAEAMAITLKNMLGLVCDPVAGLVEVPCVKRNAMGAANAMVAADMALAGITSRIP